MMRRLFVVGIIVVQSLSCLATANNGEKGHDATEKKIIQGYKTINKVIVNYDGNNTVNPFEKLDQRAFNFPDKYKTVDDLTNALIGNTTVEIEKARLIYSWVASHVQYDAKGYNSGKYGDLTSGGVYKSRKAVCTGYSNLFKKMCDIAGLEAVKVTGYAKAVGYRAGQSFSDTNHDWNSVKIDGKWKLFDSTWGAGFGTVKNGKLVSKIEYTDYWFDVQPEAFLFTHLPEDTKWQLLKNPIDKATYERMPELSEGFFRLGFDAGECLNMVKKDKSVSFPEYFDSKIHLRAVSSPYERNLSHSKTYKYAFESDEDISIALSNNGEWHFANKSGNKFTVELTPKKGTLQLCVKKGGKEGSYDVLLVYQVK